MNNINFHYVYNLKMFMTELNLLSALLLLAFCQEGWKKTRKYEKWSNSELVKKGFLWKLG